MKQGRGGLLVTGTNQTTIQSAAGGQNTTKSSTIQKAPHNTTIQHHLPQFGTVLQSPQSVSLSNTLMKDKQNFQTTQFLNRPMTSKIQHSRGGPLLKFNRDLGNQTTIVQGRNQYPQHFMSERQSQFYPSNQPVKIAQQHLKQYYI